MTFLKKQQLKRIGYILEYTMTATIFFIIKHLSFKSKSFASFVIGRFAIYPYLRFIEKKRFNIFKNNINIVSNKIFSNKEHLHLFKKYCTYITKVFFTTTHQNQFTKQWLENNVKEENFEQMLQAHKNGEKIIITSAHFGNWEIAQHYLTKVKNLPLTVMYREQNNIRVSKLLYNNRKDIQLIEKRNKSSLKQMLQSLNSGRIVIVLLDQKDSLNGSPIQFFGKTTMLPTAIARIAIKNQCKVFTCKCTAEHLTISCENAIESENFSDETILTQAIFKTFEKWISANPTNWYCLTHNIWNYHFTK